MRELIIDVRAEEGDTPAEVDNVGLGAVAQKIVTAWASGAVAPGLDTHVEKTRVTDPDGNWVGFNYYLVAGEPRSLGVRTEVDQKSAAPA